MNKEEILKRLQEIIDLLNDENNEDVDTEALQEESRQLNEKLKEINKMEERKRVANGINNGTVIANNVTPNAEEERHYTDTLQYRKAFKDYVLSGKESAELRENQTTKTTDIGAVIPNTIINKIYEKIANYGKIFAKVTKTNIKGGVTVPTSTVKPVANWVAEGSVADKQKKSTGTIIFAYNKLQVRVAISLEADTVSLEVFEKTVVDNCYEAIIVALEKSIFVGTGTGQPKGVIVGATAKEISKVSYATLCEIEGEVDEAYDETAEHYMTKKNYFTNVVGLVDTNGQPIARTSVGIDGKPEYSILGRKVNFVPADYLGGKFDVIVDLSDYIINSNMQLTMKKYFDEDTDEWVNKCTMICDGKLVSDQSRTVVEIKTTPEQASSQKGQDDTPTV